MLWFYEEGRRITAAYTAYNQASMKLENSLRIYVAKTNKQQEAQKGLEQAEATLLKCQQQQQQEKNKR